jgi:hypothetical protein
MRVQSFLAVIAFIFAGCASDQPDRANVRVAHGEISNKKKDDIYEAIVRYSLRRAPLARGSKLYIYINDGAPPGLAQRFPEYDVIIKSGSAGNSPPHERWYFIVLGVVTDDHAFATLFAVKRGLFLELAKTGTHWTVTNEYPAIT